MINNELFEKGKIAFNKAQFFEAHDIWEEIWQNIRLNNPDSLELNALQALIQIAVALHLISEKRFPGATKVFERARLNIEKADIAINAVDVKALYQKIISFYSKDDFDNCLSVKI
jgi:predicted metal-dependent hydrolase